MRVPFEYHAFRYDSFSFFFLYFVFGIYEFRALFKLYVRYSSCSAFCRHFYDFTTDRFVKTKNGILWCPYKEWINS